MFLKSYLLLFFVWGANNRFGRSSKLSNDSIELFLNEKHDDWWIVDQEKGRTRQVFIRFVELDEGKIHSCYQYKAKLNYIILPLNFILGDRATDQ